MRIGRFLITNSVVVVLLLVSGLATQTSDVQGTRTPSTGQSPDSTTQNGTTASTSTEKRKSEKEKHWSGSLVDANCMAKAISGMTQSSSQSQAGTTQRELPEPVPQNPAPQADRSPRMGPGQQQAGALPPGQNPDQNPDLSQAQAAQMARAARIDNEAKQCAATIATTVFGLALPDGQVVRFDDEGNAKAGAALKAVVVEPGKRVKATVTGTLEGGDTVKVAAVGVKGKRSSPASATQGR
jgi:hypothetical protein